jgi:hypothetical protein
MKPSRPALQHGSVTLLEPAGGGIGGIESIIRFSSAPVRIWPYLFAKHVRAGVRKRARSYVLVAHAGHGANSYAIHHYLVRRPLRLFLQIGWGGMYTDAPKVTEKVNRCFASAERLVASVDDAARARRLRPTDRLVIAASGFYGSYWIRPGREEKEDIPDRNPLVALTTVAQLAGGTPVTDQPIMALERLGEAVALAEKAHRPKLDKGSGRPYIAHPMRVAATVIDAGGTANQVYAALLHDVLEDAAAGEQVELRQKVAAFGETVERIVVACSDAKPDDGHKSPWLGRKRAHIDHLRDGVLEDAYLVVAADKLDAVERLLAEADEKGPFWKRNIFKGGRLGTIWYYQSMTDIVASRLRDNALAMRLRAATDKLVILAGCKGMSLEEILADAKTLAYPDGIKEGEK